MSTFETHSQLLGYLNANPHAKVRWNTEQCPLCWGPWDQHSRQCLRCQSTEKDIALGVTRKQQEAQGLKDDIANCSTYATVAWWLPQ